MVNILYVEDDAQSREVMAIIAESSLTPMSIMLYVDSREFESRLLAETEKPDVIFLDIHVKPLSGLQMLHIIRSHRAYDLIPVVALTASVMNEEVAMLKEAGFDGVISKPLDYDHFPDLLPRILGGEHIWNIL